MIANIRNEFQNLSAFNSNNIIKVYELFISHSKGRVAMIMEYSEFLTIDAYVLLNGTFGGKTLDLIYFIEHNCYHLLKNLFTGIRTMHTRNICHRYNDFI